VIPTTGPLNATTIQRFQVPRPADATGDGALGDIRPFAVKVYNGLVYVGMVNSAESTQKSADLHAYVYTFDPATNTWGSAPVLEFGLNYARGTSKGGSDQFLPWSPTFQNLDTSGFVKYPQAMLTGLAFDGSGNMIVGIRDRTGDQTGVGTPSDPGNPSTALTGIGAGDVLRATLKTPGNPAAGWSIEINGNGSAGAGNSQGPGGGEFFYQDDFSSGSLNETAAGGVVQLPGVGEVVTSSVAGQRNGSNPTAGFRWLSNTTGQNVKGYVLDAAGTN